MSFWLIAAVLTIAACAALLWPFRRGATLAAQGAHDVEVYRDQLRELERDTARGMVPESEAGEARAEIGRRLLKAAGASTSHGGDGGRLGRASAMAAVLAVPVIAWGGYALTGSPALPDQRLAERMSRNPAESSIDELVARAEQHLAVNPSDVRGWEVLAPIYMRIGRSADAATAWRSAIRLGGSTAFREAGLGEALTAVAAGVVSAEAEEAFARALALDPQEPRARYFLAVAMLQEGRTAEAADALRRFAADLPQQSPWHGPVGRALASLDDTGGAGPGPDADAIAAAESMSAEDRRAMIGNMVAGLDARLRENPADPEGWQRLVRSYQVLGEPSAASDALARGVAGLGEGSEAANALVEFGLSLGVEMRATR